MRVRRCSPAGGGRGCVGDEGRPVEPAFYQRVRQCGAGSHAYVYPTSANTRQRIASSFFARCADRGGRERATMCPVSLWRRAKECKPCSSTNPHSPPSSHWLHL